MAIFQQIFHVIWGVMLVSDISAYLIILTLNAFL